MHDGERGVRAGDDVANKSQFSIVTYQRSPGGWRAAITPYAHSLHRMTTGPSQKPCSPRKRSSRRFRQLAQLCDVMVWSQRRPFSHGPREAGCTGYCPHPDPPCKAADALFDIYRPCAASATLLSFREGVRHVANSPEWQRYSWHDLDPILNVINSLRTQQGSIRLSNGCNLVSK